MHEYYTHVSHLLLATTNKGKIIEISQALSGLNLHITSPVDFGISDAPHEHGDTFEANAIEKARFYFEKAKTPTLADDSGIIVEALQNERGKHPALGVHTRRWGAGPNASDQEWIDYFLSRMKQEKNKRARFVCVLCYIDRAGKERLFEGRCDGVITETLEAGYLPGLPISACFKPDGYSVVYSAMSTEQKNSTSHRGKAINAFRAFLKSRKA